MRPTPDIDPAQAVAEPVARALNALILGAAASFGLSVAAVLLAVVTPDGPIHEFGHFALPGVMAIVVLGRAVHVVRRRRAPDPNAWGHAQRLHGWDAVLARGLTVSVPLAWLAGAITVIVHHESVLHPALPIMAAWLPIAATVWILATFAWYDFCRDRVAAALDESDRRYRTYWKDLGRTS